MTYKGDTWKNFRYALDRYQSELKRFKYVSVFEPHDINAIDELDFYDFPLGNGLSTAQVDSLFLPALVGSPHGAELLEPGPPPEVPKFPVRPTEPAGKYDGYVVERATKLENENEVLKKKLNQLFHEDIEKLQKVRHFCSLNDSAAIKILMIIALTRHPMPEILRGPTVIAPDVVSRVLLATIEIPNFQNLQIIHKRGTSWKAKWVPVSASERKRCREAIIYALTIRTAYLLANADFGNWFDTIAVNANQLWHDPATGAPREGIIASVQAMKSELVALQLDRLDPKTCFRHLKGISTPSIDQVAPVRPIFVLNTADNRIIENKSVAEQLDQEANLAAMPWEDFEQLVRQLFEWEFGRNGVEVKVTRASRDRGVDAIMFDPDPLRGGKYVLQAKRYTRPVDVAAVRDLYGTVMNEGANRGILVTTSSYGPDSYEFAKDKPISLVDGPNLIAMLKRHGRDFRVDLAEARRLGEIGDRD